MFSVLKKSTKTIQIIASVSELDLSGNNRELSTDTIKIDCHLVFGFRKNWGRTISFSLPKLFSQIPLGLVHALSIKLVV